MIVLAAPAPATVRLLSIRSSLDSRYMPAGTITVSPGVASAIAWRSEPGPLSFWLVTVIEAPAAVAVAGKTITRAATSDITITATRFALVLWIGGIGVLLRASWTSGHDGQLGGA